MSRICSPFEMSLRHVELCAKTDDADAPQGIAISSDLQPWVKLSCRWLLTKTTAFYHNQ